MMCIKISKYLKGYRNKYVVDYFLEDDGIIHLFDFDEKEIFNTRETGSGSNSNPYGLSAKEERRFQISFLP